MSREKYLVKAVVHSAQVLAVFRSQGEALPLAVIAKRAGLGRCLVFRQLYTLEHCGFVERIAKNLYRLRAPQFRVRRSATELSAIAS